MLTRKTRAIIAVLVLAATAVAFVIYFSKNPDVLTRLQGIPFGILALLLALYAVFMASLIWIQRATLELCNLELKQKESTLLVMYSSVINFFGPLQSGPGFRAAYLKKRHNVNLKKYTLATFLYYGLYALFSGVLLLSFVIGIWSLVVCLVLAIASPLLLRTLRFRVMPIRHLTSLALASLAQVIIISIIYYVELQSLAQGISYAQALTYSGAANFALFVSLTPGAIGFRESFLLFSQQIHGISSEVIVAASLLDRSIYVLLLLIMATVIFGMHAGDYLKINKDKK